MTSSFENETRQNDLADWLTSIIDDEFILRPASGDASFRRYFRVQCGEKSYIAMDAPPDKESCDVFIDVGKRLSTAGVNVPDLLAEDRSQGFLLLTDFGEQQYLQAINPENADALYQDAIESLLSVQQYGRVDGLPVYDESLLLSEIQLFNEWLLGKHIGYEMNISEQAGLRSLYRVLVDNALSQPQVFVHRDYHSRNLMVVPGNNPGVLDYQDAVLGPAFYDIVSLLKDCYIKWPREQIQHWLEQFTRGLHSKDVDYDSSDMQRWFDLMGVQRHLKASGIFCRLNHRDGKDGYLKDVPRTLSYILDLQSDYAELTPLCDLIQTHIMPKWPELESCVP